MARQQWTKADLEDLKRICAIRRGRLLDWKTLARRFPKRSQAAIYKQVYTLGLCRPQTWTAREDEVLLLNWNDSSISALKRYLPGRTRIAIYERAKRLNLRAGPPQGMVSVKALSEDAGWGYDYYKTLRMLSAAGITVRVFGYAGKKRGVRYVEIDEARRAAREWERGIADQRVGKETTKEAAARLHIREETLRGWLRREGVVPDITPGRKLRFWALPEVFDAVYERYRSRIRRGRQPLREQVNEDRGG